jgi:hypothetical protein
MKSFKAFIKEDANRLKHDILSLKRNGWKLDKIIKFFVTKGPDYGIKMTSDMITKHFNSDKPMKVKLSKKPQWPKDPPASKRNDANHATMYIGQAIASEESPDMTGEEGYELLRQAGYSEKVIAQVLKNTFGWSDSELKRHLARKGKITP